MNVAEVMVSSVNLLGADANLLTAARMMKRFDIGCVLIGSDGHLAGILTDRDIVLRGVATGEELDTVTMAEIMTPDPMFCWARDSIEQAIRIMHDSQVRRLPVLNEDRTVAGIVSISDICKHVSHRKAGELIDAIASPPKYATL